MLARASTSAPHRNVFPIPCFAELRRGPLNETPNYLRVGGRRWPGDAAAMTNAQQAPAAAGPATPAQLEQQLAEHDANLGVADWLTITQPGHDTFQLADYVERRRGELIADGSPNCCGQTEAHGRTTIRAN